MSGALFEKLFDEFAARVAEKLAEMHAVAADYTQDSPPDGMSRNAYLRHCRAGDWPATKRGRLWSTTRADFESWCKANTKTKPRAVNDNPSVDQILESLPTRPARRGRRA